MLISIFRYLFYYLYRQLQGINSFKYMKMEVNHLNINLYYTFKTGVCGLFYYAVYRVIICTFVKKCSISNSEKLNSFSQMSSIDVYA